MEDRALTLLKAARDLLIKQKEAGVLISYPLTIHYDEADCDGYCLLDDINAHLLDEQVVSTSEEYYLRCKVARGRYADKEALDRAIKILDEIHDSKTVYTDYSIIKISDSTAEEFEYARKALQDRRVCKSEMKWFSAGELPTIGPEGMSRYVLAQLKDKRYVVVRLVHFGDEYWNDVEESTSYNLDEIERWRELPE